LRTDSKKKIGIVLALAMLFSLIQLGPTLAMYALPSNKIFLGFESPGDPFVYAAFVEDAKHGLFLENKQTSDPQLGRYFLPLFSALGVFAAAGIPIATLFIVERFFEIIFLLLCLWYFLGLFFSDFRKRLFSFAFISFAGGLGWLIALLGNVFPLVARIKSSDLSYWLAVSLVSNMYVPHRYWALGFALLAFVFTIQYMKQNKLKYLLASGFLVLASFLIHPVTAIFLATTLVVMQAILAFREKKITKTTAMILLVLALFLLPALLYSAWARQDPVIAAHQEIYFLISKKEPLPFYITCFGMVLVLGLLGAAKIQQEKTRKILLLSWLGSAFVLSQIGFGVEYMIFLYVILAILASVWLIERKNKLPRWAFVGLVLFSVLSAPFVLMERTRLTIADPLAFVSPAEKGAFDFLAAQPKGIVLAEQRIGAILSWETSHKPIAGQGYLTVNGKEKRQDIANFFNGDLNILYKYNPDYVWYDKAKVPPEEKVPPGLKMIYANEEVQIYGFSKTT